MNNKFVKEKFDILTSDMYKWDLIKTGTIFKPEYRINENELVMGYMNAARCLYSDLIRQNHPNNALTTIRINSLIIPFLFVCRHTIELSLKIALDNQKVPYGNMHSLYLLFSKLELKKPVEEDYTTLMEVLDMIDDKGMWLRYDRDLKNKKEYIEKPLFVNSSEIIKTTEEFTKFLLK